MAEEKKSRSQDLWQALQKAVLLRRIEIAKAILQSYGPQVQEGPFKGMTLLGEVCWGDGDLAPKLLGCYEAELHAAIGKAIGRKPAHVVNVGCAEGYYTIGLARAIPGAKVFAFDTSDKARSICSRAADANAVGKRITVGGECDANALRRVISDNGHTLLLVDCEGAELKLLDFSVVPDLRRCDVIVECHDFMDRAITPALRERLEKTHEVEEISEGARDPNRYPALQKRQSIDRWIAVHEGRPETMHWLACWAR